MDSNCKNCGKIVKEKFCPNCGQSTHTQELNLHYLMHELQHSILHVDKGIFYTAKELFLRPGHSIREYDLGKRVNHFKPFAYVFLLSTIYNLLLNAVHKENFLDKFLQGIMEGFNSSGLKLVPMIEWIRTHYAFSMLILIPIFSLASYLCFNNRGYNYIQFLVMTAFIYGQCTIIYLILLPIKFFANDGLETYVDVSMPILALFYTFFVHIQFFNKHSKIKSLLLSILNQFIYWILLFLIMTLIVFFFLAQG